jgi:hypothetical protein
MQIQCGSGSETLFVSTGTGICFVSIRFVSNRFVSIRFVSIPVRFMSIHVGTFCKVTVPVGSSESD